MAEANFSPQSYESDRTYRQGQMLSTMFHWHPGLTGTTTGWGLLVHRRQTQAPPSPFVVTTKTVLNVKVVKKITQNPTLAFKLFM